MVAQTSNSNPNLFNPKISHQCEGSSLYKSKKNKESAKKKTYSDIMCELARQKNRKTVRLDIDGKTYNIKNPEPVWAEDLAAMLAERLYESIRKSDTDIRAIAENTKFKADKIKRCKDHIFYNEHLLDLQVKQGEPTEIKRFDANFKQALSWQRLEAEVHTGSDMNL